MWKNILVAHDFSPCSERALRVAVDLARVHGAAIAIVHVSALPGDLSADTIVEPQGSRSPVSLADYTTRGARERLDEIAARIRREGISVVTKAVAGEAAQELLAAADELRANVLVIGSHGRTGLSHLLLGSVAEAVVRRASVPVVTVRSPSPEAEPTSEERDVQDELDG